MHGEDPSGRDANRSQSFQRGTNATPRREVQRERDRVIAGSQGHAPIGRQQFASTTPSTVTSSLTSNDSVPAADGRIHHSTIIWYAPAGSAQRCRQSERRSLPNAVPIDPAR